jgi:hypothetical protein
MEARAIWNLAQPTPTQDAPHCTAFTLPSNGVLTFDDTGDTFTLTADAAFLPECTGTSDILQSNSLSSAGLRDPFYASTLPQCYALAATTVIAYMLFIMLLITPRTFLLEGAVVLGRRGFTNGPSGSDAGIGIGGRPWLQKVATLTVAISLSIATADTFRVAESQYYTGTSNAASLQSEVENGTELKIIRIISDTFLWLAQAQTLIRLFPRQREKIIIKWTAFALISLDVLFSLLNDFVYEGSSRPHSFVNAVPALTYLFELALSLLYCAWVMYYAFTKSRFAFYHPQMKNICLVALLSIVSIMVPVVFFVLDVSKPTLASWGDYVRWVGAAAASVTVWEWVERIEALERNEKKDGVLGREVFDGDEMLDVTPASNYSRDYSSKKRKGSGKGDGGTTTSSTGLSWPTISSRHVPKTAGDVEATGGGHGSPTGPNIVQQTIRAMPPLWPTRPPPTATPVSRTDTASAESTVYAVRYHPISEATPSVRDNTKPPDSRQSTSTVARSQSQRISGEGDDEIANTPPAPAAQETQGAAEQHHKHWRALAAEVNPFKSRARQPPAELSALASTSRQPANNHDATGRWDLRSRLETFAASKAEKIKDKTRASPATEPLSVTVIPAPTRRRDLATTLEELESAEPERPWSPPASGQAPSAPSAESNRSHRPSDPYTPDDLGHRSITQRGTISFVSPGHDGRAIDDLGASSSVPDGRRVSSPPPQPQSQSSGPETRGGLPVIKVPTPQRPARSGGSS